MIDETIPIDDEEESEGVAKGPAGARVTPAANGSRVAAASGC